MTTLREALEAPAGTTVTNVGPVYIVKLDRMKSGIGKGGSQYSFLPCFIQSADGANCELSISTKQEMVKPGTWINVISATRKDYNQQRQLNCDWKGVQQLQPAQPQATAVAPQPVAAPPPMPMATPPPPQAPPAFQPPPAPPQPMPTLHPGTVAGFVPNNGIKLEEFEVFVQYFRDVATGVMPRATTEAEMSADSFGRRCQAIGSIFSTLIIAYTGGKFDEKDFVSNLTSNPSLSGSAPVLQATGFVGTNTPEWLTGLPGDEQMPSGSTVASQLFGQD